ncbi:hypothetical protein [Liquorilactobacillus hordei]|uniref:Uncharacterized protein n=1 Tax=Liquorilactobacillus hordei DSM 19519 TaxID=1423759 RepID=A0A0R1MJA8_9LACO|nr:hypothetical protein [Liquorilactobacillus hordei]KRL08048.1 hypothetical protein FC92_GL001122 [Liquorilactobacillus hordei DSM 19519]QYH51008.1 hypothetical protein G6O70_00135 [Liquorilactobacillus hordei DSM 19519]
MTREEIIEAVENEGVSIRDTDDEKTVPDMVETNVDMLGMSYKESIQQVLYGE